MTRRRTDRNQAEIMAGLRAAGVHVTDTSMVGGGFPDLVCGFGGVRTVLLEIKDPLQPPSKRQLTPHQREWHAAWCGGPVAVVTDLEGALRACGV